jgi:hypothetical protein
VLSFVTLAGNDGLTRGVVLRQEYAGCDLPHATGVQRKGGGEGHGMSIRQAMPGYLSATTCSPSETEKKLLHHPCLQVLGYGFLVLVMISM